MNHLFGRATCLLLYFMMCVSYLAFAQKSTNKTCARAVTEVDTFISQMDWASAQATMQQTLDGNPDNSCRRKLLSLAQRMDYAQGQYRVGATQWTKEEQTFGAVAGNPSIPYPENTGFLFAGLNKLRLGNWNEGGRLITIGLKSSGYNLLRRMQLQDLDIHYIIAGIGAGMDTIPALASPLIPAVMSKWESGNNRLSVLADTGSANYYLGRVLVEYREWAAAIPFLQKDLGKPVAHPRATAYLLGKCYNELGQYDKAVALLRPLFDNDKSDWVTLELERALNGADRMKK